MSNENYEEEKRTLMSAFKDVEETGNRLGILKKERIPLAESLVNDGLLVRCNLPGTYKLKNLTQDK